MTTVRELIHALTDPAELITLDSEVQLRGEAFDWTTHLSITVTNGVVRFEVDD